MHTNDWFKTWFASPYYEILYKNRNEDEASQFIDKLLSYLAPAPTSKFLDAACGKGRHAIYLNSKGYDVTGIDLSGPSILHASKYRNDNLSFFVHDMRKEFRNDHFDYIFNFFTSFGYFDNEQDNTDTINAFNTALKKNGILILDFFNAHKVITNLKKSEVKTIDKIRYSITRTVKDNFVIKNISISDKGKEHKFEERVQLLQLEDFTKYCAISNLKIINLFGDYDLNVFNENSSERLIIIAQKTS